MFSSLGGSLLAPKPGYAAPTTIEEEDTFNRNKLWTNSYLCFLLPENLPTDTHSLSIERDHPSLINEAYNLISTLLSLP